MRSNLVAVGLLLALIGAALWYYPLQSGTTGATTIPNGSAQILGLGLPFAVLGMGIPYSGQWQASSSISLKVYDCGSDSSCSLFGSTTPVVNESGTSGTFSWTGHRGQYFAVVPSGGPATVVVNFTEPILGGALGVAMFLLGIVVVILGVGLSRRVTATERRVPARVQTTATTEQEGVVVEERTDRR